MCRSLTVALTAVALMFCATGCFTGVEGTPRIKASDVRKQHASTVTPEQNFLSDIIPEPPAQWRTGKPFIVANDRISLIFNTGDNAGIAPHAGEQILFEGFEPARTLTGDDATDAIFRSTDGRRHTYRLPGTDASRLDTLSRLDIPFTVDPDLVARIDSAMRGNRYWVRTPSWYTPDTRVPTSGLRHVEVLIDSIVPGDENFPAAVYFTLTDPVLRRKAYPDGRPRMLYMSVGRSKAATRTFDVLFAFENPRRRYPDIQDDVWDLIITSRVRPGMTRDECRLALGAPAQLTRIPTYGGMAERWTYSDGIYLIFEDGFLTRFRL